MKHREPILRKLDTVESNLNKINLFLNRGDREGAKEILDLTKDALDQIRLYVENEPISGHELNP